MSSILLKIFNISRAIFRIIFLYVFVDSCELLFNSKPGILFNKCRVITLFAMLDKREFSSEKLASSLDVPEETSDKSRSASSINLYATLFASVISSSSVRFFKLISSSPSPSSSSSSSSSSSIVSSNSFCCCIGTGTGLIGKTPAP